MPDSSAHPSIAPAQGWWAVYRAKDHSTFRERVAVWMTEHVSTHDAEYDTVKAWVAGDQGYLLPATTDRGDSFSYLWHEGDSFCHCGRSPLDPQNTDDIYWCPRCAGVIHP